MKIRTGFVSNSSVSSFVVWGYSFDEKQAKELVSQIPDGDVENYLETLDEIFSKVKLQTQIDGEYRGNIMAGLCPNKMEEDETLRQFKDRVRKLVVDSLGISEVKLGDPGYIEEASEDR